MNLSCMPEGIVDILHPGQGAKDIRTAGYSYAVLDMSMYARELSAVEKANRRKNHEMPEHISVVKNPGTFSEKASMLLSDFAKAGIEVSALYAPYLNSAETDHSENKLIRELSFSAVCTASSNNIPFVIIRPLFAGISYDRLWDENKSFYLELSDAVGDSDTMILLENMGRSVGGHLVRSVCADPTEAAQWIDELNSIAGKKRFGLCLNIGTSALSAQNPYEYIIALGERIKAVLLSDTDGVHDKTFMPFSTYCGGPQTDWLGVIRGLREIGFDGELMMAMDQMAYAVSPMIRPQLLMFSKAIADYITWQIQMEAVIKKYEKRVLFGAGNMCINYMKNYGEKYPPLYTCDNNSARWGDTIEGISIKSPEELKKLDPDTAIFICNVFYREIEEQLRAMNLENPIEYFNDEYLPVLNMNRIERS